MAETHDLHPDEFSSALMLNAARSGNVDDLVAALAVHPNLIDTPHPNDQRTPMSMAANNGHVSVIEKLVELGSNAIDTRDRYGCTPLHAAASNGHVSAIETLVRLGSNAIDTPDNEGWTPLRAAARNGHVSVIEALIRLGSKAIDTPNKYGWTPLFAAAYQGHVSVIEALVRLGSNAIDTPDNGGWTPLFAAGRCGNIECMKTLMALNADRNTSTRYWPESAIKRVQAGVSEDEAASIRYRVYFAQSLVSRLLDSML